MLTTLFAKIPKPAIKVIAAILVTIFIYAEISGVFKGNETLETKTAPASQLFALSGNTYYTGLAWAPDGNELGALSDFGKRLDVWDEGGKFLRSISLQGSHPSKSLALWPLAELALMPGRQTQTQQDSLALTLWNTKNGQAELDIARPRPRNGVPGPKSFLFSVSSSRQYAAGPLSNSINSPVIVYSFKTQSDIRIIPVVQEDNSFDSAISIGFSSDETLLAIGTVSGHLIISELNFPFHNTYISIYPSTSMTGISSVSFSPNSSLLAIGASKSGIRAASSQPAIYILKTQSYEIVSRFGRDISPIRQLSWSPDGRYLLIAPGEAGFYLWDTGLPSDNSSKVLLDHSPTSAIFSPSSNKFAVTNGKSVLVFSLNR